MAKSEAPIDKYYLWFKSNNKSTNQLTKGDVGDFWANANAKYRGTQRRFPDKYIGNTF